MRVLILWSNVKNNKAVFSLLKWNTAFLIWPDCLTTALQLRGVWEEVATGAWEGGSQSFLLVGTKMRTALKSIKFHDFAFLWINSAFIYLVIMDCMVYVSAFSIKARTDESESYLKCLLFMFMTCPISHSSKYYAFWQSTLPFKVLFWLLLPWNDAMTHILGRFKLFILQMLQLAFIHIAMSGLSLPFIRAVPAESSQFYVNYSNYSNMKEKLLP